ncbi:hypothetical protein J3E69DRAFT_344061 [Trichoderma sp. SZMC 28015]
MQNRTRNKKGTGGGEGKARRHGGRLGVGHPILWTKFVTCVLLAGSACYYYCMYIHQFDRERERRK